VAVIDRDPEASGATVNATASATPVPIGVTLVHIGFLIAVVPMAHHPVIFIGLLLFFLGFAEAYERYQSPLMLRESLLVAFFLGGLVVLGGLQQWWLRPLVESMNAHVLYAGALGRSAKTPVRGFLRAVGCRAAPRCVVW
jgi:hypothetical protein